ncbi:DUF3596 domain-containing protein, partial [Escherichia coli]
MSKLPSGVEIRGKYISICSMFRGTRCRETFNGRVFTESKHQ